MSLAGGKIASFLDKKQWESVTEWRNWDGWQIGRKVLSKITCSPIHLIFYTIDTSNRYHWMALTLKVRNWATILRFLTSILFLQIPIDGMLDPLNGGIRLHLGSFAQGVICPLEDHVDCWVVSPPPPVLQHAIVSQPTPTWKRTRRTACHHPDKKWSKKENKATIAICQIAILVHRSSWWGESGLLMESTKVQIARKWVGGNEA